ncbi:B12-binding domain-containing radical SAM protein [Maritimibacter sp. UBA3975]|uniref:B12-binding domain-containing radical SAM protein n=1 Tax=Maritimibacter sp. UBA3975 TaxID=1946833 RepID=UPI000C0A0F9B|nr:B12-binding domain-containing radical SAM protein [Maritimibacter sp. UBA3975]MAM62805.1 B12-binding domain-containing radical SAM protein [Maritimibacter sp.]
MPGTTPNVLLVYPKFSNTSFWNFLETCDLAGAKYPAPPLGLITVAAMLPGDWPVRLIDMNTQELNDEDIDWADMVMFSGMISQQPHLLKEAARCKERGKVTVVGGPDVSSHPEVYADLDIRVIGEAEGVLDEVIEAWKGGMREGEFRAPLHTVDVTTTPVPRYDLLKLDDYLMINVQLSRGCPFLCEFCDIIELFGRKPRTKMETQILGELDRLYELGYRGHVDFVDDNLIGNKKSVKAFLPKLIEWQKKNGFPFEFSTEASLNLADDPEFLGMMRDAGFFTCFVGIESPDPDVLIAMKKKQNIKRDIAESVHTIQSYGIFVIAGFIVGFDNESEYAAQGMIELIEEASIPVAMVGLLTALPNTQLQRRLEKEGRLDPLYGMLEKDDDGDQCLSGLNFETLRPRADILSEYYKVVDTIMSPDSFFKRVRNMVGHLDVSGPSGDLSRKMLLKDAKHLITFFWNATVTRPDLRGHYWKLLAYVLRHKPRAIKHALYCASLYAHLGKFSEIVKVEMRDQIAFCRENPDASQREAYFRKMDLPAAAVVDAPEEAAIAAAE